MGKIDLVAELKKAKLNDPALNQGIFLLSVQVIQVD